MENIVTRLEYNRYNFDFESYYRDINFYFTFDKENDEFIGSDSNEHLLENDKFQRGGKPVPFAQSFLVYFYMVWRPKNTTVIVNQDAWNCAGAKERSKIGTIQQFQGSVIVNNIITMYTAIKTLQGTDNLTKYATHIKEFKILKKYVDKLRKRYKYFSLIRLDEWHFNSSLSIGLY